MTVIRPARPEDMDAVGRLGEQLVRLHHGYDPDRFLAPTSGTAKGYADFLGSQLGERRVVVLVAEQDGRVIGYAYAVLEGTDFWALRGPAGVFHDLVIDAAHRGRGVGRLLFEAMLKELQQRGAPRVVLWVAESNEASLALVRSAGFRKGLVEMTREFPGRRPS